jgi:hypothetical protein
MSDVAKYQNAMETTVLRLFTLARKFLQRGWKNTDKNDITAAKRQFHHWLKP